WPCINSHFGIMDMCGFPKDNWWYYRAWWGDEPAIHILPHWNWPGLPPRLDETRGQRASVASARGVSGGAGEGGRRGGVWVYSNADRVELFLNGRSLGVQEMPRWGHLEWQVPYAPGALVAKGYRGSEVMTDRVETTGPPATIRLKTDRTRLTADGEDAVA